VDSLTHALVAAILAYALGFPQLLPFVVIGAVIIDTDVLFSLISDRHPPLYLFTHGGIAHSLAGAVVMSVLAFVGIALAVLAGLIDPAILVRAGPSGFAAVLAGAFLHIGLDLPACPGIPLLAPASDRKYGLCILPGPSLLLMATSLVFLIWMALGVVALAGGMFAYAVILGAFLSVRVVAYLVAHTNIRGAGRAVPAINPLRWLVIGGTADVWTVRDYRIGVGICDPVVYPKFRNTDPDEVAPYLALPEVQRLRYHSYIVTAEKEGDAITFSDPLRVSGRIFYPPHFRSIVISPVSRHRA
jgi:inner membrane protein